MPGACTGLRKKRGRACAVGGGGAGASAGGGAGGAAAGALLLLRLRRVGGWTLILGWGGVGDGVRLPPPGFTHLGNGVNKRREGGFLFRVVNIIL